MTKRALLLVVVILTSIALASAAPDRKPQAPGANLEPVKGIRWRTDYNTARKESSDKRKPLVLLFFKAASPPSQRMLNGMENDEALCAYFNSATIPLKVDSADVMLLAANLGITAYPTMVLAGSDGRIRDNIVGYVEPKELQAKLKAAFGNR